MVAPIAHRARAHMETFFHKVHTNPTVQKVQKWFSSIGKWILKGITSLLLLYANPSFFVMGLFLGIAFPKQVHGLHQRMENIWNHSLGQRVFVALGGTLAGVFVFPAGLAGASALAGALWADWLVRRSESQT